MAMPGWAIGLGAALKAPEVANDYMGLFKNVQAMRDEANASEELQRIQQFKTPEEAQAYKTDSYLSAVSREKLDTLRAAKLDALLKEGAAAPLAKIQDLQMDPRFRDPESVAEISRNPSEAVFGQRRVTPSRTTGRTVDRGDGVMVNEVIPGSGRTAGVPLPIQRWSRA
jgi:hypothetical protein